MQQCSDEFCMLCAKFCALGASDEQLTVCFVQGYAACASFMRLVHVLCA